MAPRKELAAQLSLSDFIPRLFVFGLPSSRSRVYRKKNDRTNERNSSSGSIPHGLLYSQAISGQPATAAAVGRKSLFVSRLVLS